MLQLHLGVNSGALKFAIERQAANEATFRCPDELGWQPLVSDDRAFFFSSFLDKIGRATRFSTFPLCFEEYYIMHNLNSFFFAFRFCFSASPNSP